MISAAVASARPTVLWVDADHGDGACRTALEGHFRLLTTKIGDLALQFLHRTQKRPDVVIADLCLPDDGAYAICRAAKSLATPSIVLVPACDIERVPKALAAGCDGVLLKPFPPTLLITRLNQLRALTLVARSIAAQAKSRHLNERTAHAIDRTVQESPDTYCPDCYHHGVTSFEYARYGRAWYACLACEKVWLGPRRNR
jgi:CheY-like chemotaxis protein